VAIEIERKFLLASERWKTFVQRSEHIREGLIAATDQRKTRVRIAADRGTIAIKIKLSAGHRSEFEYDIPLSDAEDLLASFVGNVTEKVRHYVKSGALTWEIDEYQGDLKGVVLAEVELGSVDQPVNLPDWFGREVTGQLAYSKGNLVEARRPKRAGGGTEFVADANL
jgi:adenylate cyclase